MDVAKLTSLACRVLFSIAALALVLGVLEKIANMTGQTLMRFYSPERLLDIAVAFGILTGVLLLRQIREAIRAGGR